MGELIRLNRVKHTPTPLILVTGLPASGKTTLISRLVLARQDLRILIINEPALTRVSAICNDCGLYHQVDQALADALKNNVYDLILLEASADCDPRILVETVLTVAEERPELSGRLRLDRVINVVDLSHLWEDLDADQLLKERRTSWFSGLSNIYGADEETTVIDVLTSQAEFCDLMVVTHNESLKDHDLKELMATLRVFQNRAAIMPLSPQREFDAEFILHRTPGFDPVETEGGSSWRTAFLKLPYDNSDASHEKHLRLENGVEVFVYRRRLPFHPQRIFNTLETLWPLEGIQRSFGQLWLAIPGETAFAFSSTGPEALRFWPDGKWIAARSSTERSERMVLDPDLRSSWDGHLGDRFTEIIVLGYGLEINAIQKILDSCLVSELEYKRDWAIFENPFKEFAVTVGGNGEAPRV